jgi:hypothetical protein
MLRAQDTYTISTNGHNMKKVGFALVVVLIAAVCGVGGYEVGKGTRSSAVTSSTRTRTIQKIAASGPAVTNTHNLTIQLVLDGGEGDGNGSNFAATGGLNDGDPCYSQESTQVVVTNQSGTVLGESNTIPPVSTGKLTGASSGDSTPYGCSFNLKIANVPTAQQYGLSVNGGSPSYASLAQMQNWDWAIQLSSGN